MPLKLIHKILSLGGLMEKNKRLSGFLLMVVNYLLGLLKSKYGIDIELPYLQEAGVTLLAAGVADADIKERIEK